MCTTGSISSQILRDNQPACLFLHKKNVPLLDNIQLNILYLLRYRIRFRVKIMMKRNDEISIRNKYLSTKPHLTSYNKDLYQHNTPVSKSLTSTQRGSCLTGFPNFLGKHCVATTAGGLSPLVAMATGILCSPCYTTRSGSI